MMEGEGGFEPQDVFVELGTLIVEGRVPGGGNARGYCEGPHCSVQGLHNATLRHSCNTQQNFLCKRAENFKKHMQLLFQNNVPMCIEVILCCDCPCGVQRAQSAEVGYAPSASDLLLEQWTITYNNRSSDAAPMLPRGLVQAVRSQLHFSQLSAWWSSTKGTCPSNIRYRITVPGQAFAFPFSKPPSEHTFPLASVGKNGSIKVCARSLPRMEAVPVLHCLLHNGCLQPPTEAGEKSCLAKPCLPHLPSGVEAACGSSAVTMSSNENPAEPSLGESLLDLPQRFRSPPRAAEVPEGFLYRRLPEVSAARWQGQGDAPPSPPQGLSRAVCWWRENRPCLVANSNGQLCPRAAASKSRRQMVEQGKTCGPSGLLDDRMQMECNMPGKHHCSCEVEEEIEEIKTPTPVRQRRRSQASMPPQPPASSSSASETAVGFASNMSESVANESTKRSSGLSVMADEYLYTSDGVASNGSNTGSLKRRRPVLDTAEASCSAYPGKSSSWMDADHNQDLAVNFTNGVSCNPNGAMTGGAASFSLSPAKGSTAPVQLQPPLSERELEDVLAELRDKSNIRPNFHPLQVFYSSESASRLKEAGESHVASDATCPLLRPNVPSDTDLKTSKTDSFLDAVLRAVGRACQRNTICQTQYNCCQKEKDDLIRTMDGKGTGHCDINSDLKCLNSAKSGVTSKGQSSFRVNGCKPSYDLSEDHNNQAICDKYTSLLKCDIGDTCPCLSCVSQTQPNQTKEGSELQPSNLLTEKCKISSASVSPRPVRARSKKADCLGAALALKCLAQEMQRESQNDFVSRQDVPTASERERFRRSFDSAASMVFHTRTGLPLTSSPAPVRRGTSHFDYDSSLNSVSAIRSALFDTPAIATQMEDSLSLSSDDTESESGARSPCSPDAGIVFPSLSSCHALSPCSSLLGSFEESVLNGRLEPVSTVQGFTAEIGASGSFCPRHLKIPVTVFFYTLGDYDKVSTPYLGHINLGKKGYNVPRSGTIQVTLFNPMGTVIKMFVVMYDLSDMPPNSHTFLRQRTLYMPTGTKVAGDLPDSDLTQKWLRYLIHLRFSSSKSGRVYLHTDVRMIIFRKSDMDTASVHNNNNIDSGFELRSYTNGPGNPKFSPR